MILTARFRVAAPICPASPTSIGSPARTGASSRYLPADAGWGDVHPNNQTLDLAPATAVFAGYVVAVLAASAHILVRRDA